MVYDETDTVAPIAAAIAGIPATAHSLGRQLPEPVRRAVFEPLSEVWRAHATSAETHDALFAGTIRMKPGGGPPLLHRHDPAEVDYVLDGSSPSTPATPRDPCARDRRRRAADRSLETLPERCADDVIDESRGLSQA